MSDDEQARYRATYLDQRGDLMGLAQTLRSEGLQEGLQKGRQEGRQEGRLEGQQEGRLEGIPQGEALILRRLLTRRFGPLPDWAESKVETAGQEQLEHWALRVLDAATLDAVFDDAPPAARG